MSDLTVRKLLIDLETPFELRWNGGDAFISAFMNALSMSFPVGEQFFIDSLRRGVKELSPDLHASFAQDIKGFIGQEATHRRIHERFNQHVLNQGMVNHWEKRALRRIAHIKQKKSIHAVAITAAYEHYTSVFAAWLLNHPDFWRKRRSVCKPCGCGMPAKKPSTEVCPLIFTVPWVAMRFGVNAG